MLASFEFFLMDFKSRVWHNNIITHVDAKFFSNSLKFRFSEEAITIGVIFQLDCS
jgi:hypothetical protein